MHRRGVHDDVARLAREPLTGSPATCAEGTAASPTRSARYHSACTDSSNCSAAADAALGGELAAASDNGGNSITRQIMSGGNFSTRPKAKYLMPTLPPISLTPRRYFREGQARARTAPGSRSRRCAGASGRARPTRSCRSPGGGPAARWRRRPRRCRTRRGRGCRSRSPSKRFSASRRLPEVSPVPAARVEMRASHAGGFFVASHGSFGVASWFIFSLLHPAWSPVSPGESRTPAMGDAEAFTSLRLGAPEEP